MQKTQDRDSSDLSNIANKKNAHQSVLPIIDFPEDLPVSERRQEIQKALEQHQVIIVAGETGSGKTTQLPKICLAMGRGQDKMIGHTQPRRIAAVSVAKRIAQELKTEVGQWVGYQVRFSDRTGPRSAIKLMTDGILLAETQRDPLLKRYDTIIIDEAHERSLNIDFLLGFLKNLLPKRPDLKVIITSATIDAARFAEHFKTADNQSAEVIEVTGRMYPVEIRYQIDDPVLASSADESDDEDNEQPELTEMISDAVDECIRSGPGDILVFLPGEREIREAVDALRKPNQPTLDVLPLFARMSQADQERIFRPTTNLRRVILATNVAETSLTVPGIRFVIDSGLARVKRYSWRNKVEQLQIEPISQAAANQRAGRCGRLGPGICIRLYSAEDFNKRAEYTDPEVLRSSLASVILRMKALRLHDIEAFPFVDKPSGRAIADGYHLLQELGALNEHNRLTQTGRLLARLPLDPRIARMILAAKDHNCLTEMSIIAAALSIQDPRERPFDAQEASTQAHSKYKDKESEFISYLKLWAWYQEQYDHRESNRKLHRQLRKEFLSPVRLREWQDIHQQIRTLIDDQKWRFNQVDATYEELHRALLSGLLGNIGLRSEATREYEGARGIRYVVHPGSYLHRSAAKWIMAGELVETTRLFARTVARIEPQWIEQAGRHLLKKLYSEPHFDPRRGQVMVYERATLYGLQVYQGRKVSYARLEPKHARELFIREALVEGSIKQPLPFLEHNLRLIEEIEHLEHKSRRQDILVDDELIYRFYDQYIPEDMHQVATLEHWYKNLAAEEKARLQLDKDELMRHEAAGISTEQFPKRLEFDGLSLNLSYHFEPGSPKDGVTLEVPVYALNQIDAVVAQWLVPGMLKEKVELLLRSLPQRLRRHCVPIPDYAEHFVEDIANQPSLKEESLLNVLIDDIWQQKRIRVKAADFKEENIPPHLSMIFKVVDEHGRMLSSSRNLALLKAEHAPTAQESFRQLLDKDQGAQATLEDNKHITTWDFGELPELLEIKRGRQSVVGFPALFDQGNDCRIEVFDEVHEATAAHRKGLIRLFKIALKEQIRYLSRNLKDLPQLGMLYMALGTQEELQEEIIDCALIQSCLVRPWPNNAQEFNERVKDAKGRFGLLLQEVIRLLQQIMNEWAMALKKHHLIKAHKGAYEDIQQQLNTLIYKGFLSRVEYASLQHYPRYLRAVQLRIDKLKNDPSRDQQLMHEVQMLQTKYLRRLSQLKGVHDPQMDEFFWLLQELRVAVFAQELRTPMPVSVKRLEKTWHSLSQ
ncbi:MAG: ATP-dependent RNA helicase HrpA [Alcaligenaceae bacterium]|nr:ATP-dependent RNA helicase HrpA [Alcaligenaceae bacterium]